MFVSLIEADSLTVEVFVMIVPAVPEFTEAVIVSVAVELVASVPIVHMPVELAYVPVEAFDEMNLSVEGKVSEATTPVEVAGPRSLTLIV
jgi:hypothetical protein